MDRNNLIVKSNALVESAYKLDLLEQKILLCSISKIKKEDTDFKIISFTINELKELLEVKGNGLYKNIEIAIEKLRKKEIIIIEKDGNKITSNWVASAKYFKNGNVEISFSEHLKPYLLQLKKEFTQYQLKNILQLNSIYSIRIYELLKQYQSYQERSFTIEDLRNTLGIEHGEYKKFSDFEIYVIKKAKKEINSHTDLDIDYIKIKEGRNITKIKFTIAKKITKQEDIKIQPKELDIEFLIKVNTLKSLIHIELEGNDYISILDAAGGDLAKVIDKYYLIKNKKNITNFVGYIIDAIKEDYSEIAATKETNTPDIKTKFHNLSEERFRKYSSEEFEKIAIEKNKKKFDK